MKKMVSTTTASIVFLVAVVLLASTTTTRPAEAGKKVKVPVVCNSRNFNSTDEPQATAARDEVLCRLVGVASSHPNKRRFCTSTDVVDGSGFAVTGLATCARRFEECARCLNRARNLLNQLCRSGSGGHINLVDQNPKCSVRYEKEQFC
ncbi:unnamed protein product [Linum trigynum]|uniref:Gnk2-homologous domain-containing protein n=1 Tax=Linum trigynum TaxID=586398 RepID=A0AAV2DSR2_9ROSI